MAGVTQFCQELIQRPDARYRDVATVVTMKVFQKR